MVSTLDEMDCVGRGLGGLGDDERDRLAGPQDLLAGERLVLALVAFGAIGQVAAGEDRDDAGHRKRFRLVDRHDPGMGRHGQNGSPVEEAAHVDVCREPGAAGHLGTAVDPRDRATDRTAQSVHLISVGLSGSVDRSMGRGIRRRRA